MKTYCKDCDCWEKMEGQPNGICHRNPPDIVVIPVQRNVIQGGPTPQVDIGLNCYFPITAPTAWCWEGKGRMQ